jgi:hypothetical protein
MNPVRDRSGTVLHRRPSLGDPGADHSEGVELVALDADRLDGTGPPPPPALGEAGPITPRAGSRGAMASYRWRLPRRRALARARGGERSAHRRYWRRARGRPGRGFGSCALARKSEATEIPSASASAMINAKDGAPVPSSTRWSDCGSIPTCSASAACVTP